MKNKKKNKKNHEIYKKSLKINEKPHKEYQFSNPSTPMSQYFKVYIEMYEKHIPNIQIHI